MIKIIGKDKKAIKRITCKNCATRLEYTPSDLIDIKVNGDYLGDFDLVTGFECPNCNKNIIVELH